MMPLQAKFYPCPNCGGAMTYLPATKNLHCDYCQSDEVIDVERFDSDSKLNLDSYLSKATEYHPKKIKEIFDCPSCGADINFEESTISKLCPYCNTPLLTSPNNPLKPSAVLPFVVNHKEAQGFFKKWIGNIWFAPNALSAFVDTQKALNGLYIPFWIFDADTVSQYEGERGDAYYVTVNKRVYENGKEVVVQEEERRIRWTPVSGNTSRRFRDLPITATNILPSKLLAKLEPWATEELKNFDLRWLSGYSTYEYNLTLEEGNREAKSVMKSIINDDVLRSIGGDEQRVYSISTNYLDEKFALPLLPVWSSSFSYAGKEYNIIINAVSGKVVGERPYSYWKILFLVVSILIVVGVGVWFYNNH